MSSTDLIMSAAGDSSGPVNYVEDVFSTFLYTGNGTTQTINNGIDLAGKGGLTWFGSRNAYVGIQHYLIDSARGIDKTLNSYSTGAQGSFFNGLNSYTSTGVTLNGGDVNASGNSGVLWTFRKAPKFFDVVTFTGNGGSQNIPHSLASKPGMIIIKAINTATYNDWAVWARVNDTTIVRPPTVVSPFALNLTNSGFISTTSGEVNGADAATFNPQNMFTTSGFNQNGISYVAYLFAHNAGGFGLSGTDNVISCGSYVGGGSSQITLGWEPQWLLVKNASGAFNWRIVDTMRGLTGTTGISDSALFPNTNAAESTASQDIATITSTGFFPGANVNNASETYIYMAIRRPMKPPTSGTEVFAIHTWSQSGGL